MAINWNMDIGSLGALFKKKNARVRASGTLIPATKKIWQFSIMFLIVFAAAVVAGDAYIFLEYVYSQQVVDIGDRGRAEKINDRLFDGVIKALDERTATFERATSTNPIRNPFKK